MFCTISKFILNFKSTNGCHPEDAKEAEVNTVPLLCFYFSSLHQCTPWGLPVLTLFPHPVMLGSWGCKSWMHYFPISCYWSRTFLVHQSPWLQWRARCREDSHAPNPSLKIICGRMANRLLFLLVSRQGRGRLPLTFFIMCYMLSLCNSVYLCPI